MTRSGFAWIGLVLLASAMSAVNTAAVPSATAFTYQGELAQGGLPADGSFDFQFALYDLPTGGSLLGTLESSGITVSQGAFTAMLDFGLAQPACGEQRFLETRVRKSGGEAFTTLSPRQPLQRRTDCTVDGSLTVQGAVVVGPSLATGVSVSTATDDGYFVGAAGSPSAQATSTAKNGFEVAGAQGYGVWVGWANSDAVRIIAAGDDGIQVGDGSNLPTYGLFVTGPGTSGDTLLPNTSDASGQWALFTTDSIESANVFAGAQTLVAVVGGEEPLATGDVVTAAGLAGAIPGSVVPLAQVRLAGGSEAGVVGVVHSRMVWTPLAGLEKAGEFDLRSVDGPAQRGDYVAITVLGAAQVRVQAGESLQPGQRVTAGQDGVVRGLQTRVLEGMVITEGAPTVGVVLQPASDGLVWILVTPR